MEATRLRLQPAGLWPKPDRFLLLHRRWRWRGRQRLRHSRRAPHIWRQGQVSVLKRSAGGLSEAACAFRSIRPSNYPNIEAADMMPIDATHEPSRKSWVQSANSPDPDFPIPNLPLGIFSRAGIVRRAGVAMSSEEHTSQIQSLMPNPATV